MKSLSWMHFFTCMLIRCRDYLLHGHEYVSLTILIYKIFYIFTWKKLQLNSAKDYSKVILG